jgi:archaellum component FlaC
VTDEQYNYLVELIEQTTEKIISTTNALFDDWIQEIRESYQRKTSLSTFAKYVPHRGATFHNWGGIFVSEDQYYNIVEMIGKLGELLTANQNVQMNDFRVELTKKIESEVAVLGGRMDDLKQNMGDLTHRMDGLTQNMGDLTHRMDGLTHRMDDLTQDMKDLTHYTKRRIEVTELRQQSNDARIEAIEAEIRDIKTHLNQQQP